MARIPEEVIDEVRSSVNIFDIVSRYVQLHKSGKNWFGLCPFHPENTPSFSVNEQKQIFHCFSCGRGGNVFKFIMEVEGLSFPEAVFKVADIAGIDIDDRYRSDYARQEEAEQNSEAGQTKKAYDQVAQLFHYILMNTQAGQNALDYLHRRGLQDDIINEYNLGYAPDETILQAYLKEKGFDDYQFLRKSGLFTVHQDESLSDRFRDRVMFPIRDTAGRTIAFSGRKLNDNPRVPKYLNSPETEIFNKRNVLFNFDKARPAIKREGEAILFEGFMDVIAAYRAGIKNGVASMGTSLTDQQIYLLERYTSHLFICYDGDRPGQKAIKRALDVIEPLGKFNLGVIQLPDQLDPDECMRKYGAEKMRTLFKERRESPIAFYMYYYELDRNMDNEDDQLDYIHDILGELAKIGNKVERELYLNRLAERFNLDKQDLQYQLKKIRASSIGRSQSNPGTNNSPRAKQPAQADEQKEQFSQVEKAERLLLYRALHDHSVWMKLKEIPDFSFIHDGYQMVYTLAEGYFNIHQRYQSASFLDYLQDDSLRQIIVSLEMEGWSEDTNEEEVDDCLRMILKAPVKQQIESVQRDIKEAQRANETETVTRLTSKLVDLLQKRVN